MRLLCLCWAGFILTFFTFSTTQEYYSMPCYPALALLLGCAMASGDGWLKWGTRAIGGGDGAGAGGDLRDSVDGAGPAGAGRYLVGADPESGCVHAVAGAHDGSDDGIVRVPAAAAGGGGRGVRGRHVGRVAAARTAAMAALVAMMVLFFHAARLALVVFDPYLSSRPLAEALLAAPPGKLIVDDQYYTFSSVFFYTNRRAYLLNGRVNNLDYGSYAPDAPQDVFIDDADFQRLWTQRGAVLPCGRRS